jgi:hypothetical protein
MESKILMLKLTYTENGFFLEHLTESLEKWVTTRVLLSLRVGTSIFVEPSTASFLMPVASDAIVELKKLQKDNQELISLIPCDGEYVEVCLEGTWVTSGQENDEGIFICAIGDLAESCLEKIWQKSQMDASVLSE